MKAWSDVREFYMLQRKKKRSSRLDLNPRIFTVVFFSEIRSSSEDVRNKKNWAVVSWYWYITCPYIYTFCEHERNEPYMTDFESVVPLTFFLKSNVISGAFSPFDISYLIPSPPSVNSSPLPSPSPDLAPPPPSSRSSLTLFLPFFFFPTRIIALLRPTYQPPTWLNTIARFILTA